MPPPALPIEGCLLSNLAAYRVEDHIEMGLASIRLDFYRNRLPVLRVKAHEAVNNLAALEAGRVFLAAAL
jgi:hypothetical protein